VAPVECLAEIEAASAAGPVKPTKSKMKLGDIPLRLRVYWTLHWLKSLWILWAGGCLALIILGALSGDSQFSGAVAGIFIAGSAYFLFYQLIIMGVIRAYKAFRRGVSESPRLKLSGRIFSPTNVTVWLLILVGLYSSITWFFFGSPHPCGILEARRRPYVLSKASEHRIRLLDSLRHYTDSMEYASGRSLDFLSERHTEILREADSTDDALLKRLKGTIWNQMTPSQCLWESLAWDVDPERKK
jgi:hypothetical protein